MSLEAVYTLAVVLLMVLALAFEWAGADVIFFTCLSLLLFAGIISPGEAFSGFSNTGLIIVGLLFVVSAAVQNTGALNSFAYKFLPTRGRRRLPMLLLRMMVPVCFLSGFIANTPLVIILVPLVKRWAEKIRISPSKFFIPLSYATILGGMCTLIGTSTNVVVHGLMLQSGLRGLKFFELGLVGLPCAASGLLYLAFAGSRILPDRKDLTSTVEENKKEYVVEVKILDGCELAGKTVKEAGLRNLRGLFLVDIERHGSSLGPISSKEILAAGDRLMFAGLTSAVVDLQHIPGLVPADDTFEQDFANIRTHLVEAVISSNSPILGLTVKDADFRAKYGAGVLAVHRNGERIQSKIGSIELKAGDTLLLFASEAFVRNWKDSQDFFLVSSLKTLPPLAHRKSRLTLGITLAMILLASIGPEIIRIHGRPFDLVLAILAAVIALGATRCIPAWEARKSIHWDIIVMIGCSFGISRALEKSGAAAGIAGFITERASEFGPWGCLAAVYLITCILTEFLTNNAAAALAFPIAMSVAAKMHANPVSFAMAVAIAASASFITPIGYQTNLIVQGVGGYKFSDYVKTGFAISLICFLISVLLIPVFWPL